MIFDPTSSDLHFIWKTYKDFEGFARQPGLDLNHFIEEWKERMAKVQSAGCQYSDLLLGLKLIEKINLSHDSIGSVISKLSSSTSVSESFLSQVVTNIKELNETNGLCENERLGLANIIKRDVDDQEILEELDVKSNPIYCSKCPGKFSDIESLSKHLHEFHPDMTNDKAIDSKWGIRSDLDYLTSPICDKNLMVKETLKKNLNYKNSFVEQAWVDSSEVDAVSQMDAATLTPDVKIEIKIETSTDPEVGQRIGKRFRCEICSKEFPALWKVKRHMSVHSTAKPYKCRYCDMSSKCLESLKSHVKRAHLEEQEKEKNVNPSDIQDGMDTSERFSEIQIKENISLENSSVEQVTISSSENDPEVRKEETHSETRIECEEPKSKTNSDKVFSCGICSKRYSKLWKVNKHMKVHKTTKDYICSYCDNTYKGSEGLRLHLKKNHLEERRKADSGPKNPSSSIEIKNEEKTALNYNTNEKEPMSTFPCEICGKSFSKYNLQSHIKKTHRAKIFKCDNCPKEFIKLRSLERHKNTHNTTLECSICQKTWKNSTVLRIHMETHKTTRDYVCSYCGKKYKTFGVYKLHLNLHTKEKPLPCNFCDKIFFEHSNRRFHIRRYHTGEKPYKCDFCDRRFFTSSKKTCHMRTHTGEKPFTCQVCGKCFRETTTLKRHVRNVHKIVNPSNN